MSNSANNEEEFWSNELCVVLAFQKFFPSVVKNQDTQKRIINKMLNLYLGGKKEKGLSVADIIFAAISIMPLNENDEKLIWNDPHYRDGGKLFFLSADEKLEHDIDELKHPENYVSKVTTSTEIHKSKDTDKQTLPKYNQNNAQRVYDENKYLQNKNTVKEDVKEKEESYNTYQTSDSDSYSEYTEYLNSSGPEPQTSSEFWQGVSQSSSFSQIDYSQQSNEIPSLKEKNIRWFGKSEKINSVKDERIVYGPLENSAFTKYCNNLLDQWDTSPKSRIILKYFFGIVGLTLMRGTTKSYMHLVNTFSGRKFRNYVSFMVQFCNPHKKCVKNSYRVFSRKEDNIRIMFAKIVVNSFKVSQLVKKEVNWNIFKITVIAHTADYGFNLVNMLRNILMIEGQSNRQIDLIIKATHCPETANSWLKLTQYLKKYMADTSKETTHHWARIIDPNNFKSLTCSNNYALAVILGVFTEILKKDAGIWKSTWVVNDDSNIEKYMKLGREMYKKYKILKDTAKQGPFRVSLQYTSTPNTRLDDSDSQDTLFDVEDSDLDSNNVDINYAQEAFEDLIYELTR